MTDTRKWTLGAVVVAVLVLVVGWFLLISPKRADIADLKAETVTQQDKNSQLETERDLLKEQNKTLPEKQAELAALQTKIPETSDLPAYIRELQDLASKSGVSLDGMTPTDPVSIGGLGAPQIAGQVALTPDTLAAQNLTIVLSGDYFGITKFVNGLETGERYTLLSGLEVKESESATDTSTDTSTSSSTTSGTEPALTATLNARIYLVPTAPEVTTETGATPAPTSSPAP